MELAALLSFAFVAAALAPLWLDASRRPEYGERPRLLLAALVAFLVSGALALCSYLLGDDPAARLPLAAALFAYAPAFFAAEYSVHVQRIRKNLLAPEFASRFRGWIPAAAVALASCAAFGLAPVTPLGEYGVLLALLAAASLAAFFMVSSKMFDLEEGIIRRRAYPFVLGGALSAAAVLAAAFGAPVHVFLLALNLVFAARVYHEYFLFRMKHLNDIHALNLEQKRARSELIEKVLASNEEEDVAILRGILETALKRLQDAIPNPALKFGSLMFFRATGGVLAVDSPSFIVGHCVPLLNLESLKRMKAEAAAEHIRGQAFDLARVRSAEPLDPADFAAAWVRRMAEGREPVLATDLPEHLGHMFRLIALYPVFNRERLDGMLVLFKDGKDYVFPQEKNVLEETIGYLSIATTLIEGKRVQADKNRVDQEMDVARSIQVSVLPKSIEMPGYDVAAEMVTATEVGGDLYDFARSGQANYLDVGDVSGHGLPAGIMALLHLAAFQAAVRAGEALGKDLRPDALYDLVNRVLVDVNRDRIGSDKFMTCAMLREEGGRFVHAGAHLVGLVYRAASGKAEFLRGMIDRAAFLGISEYARSEGSLGEFVLAAGDALLLYTDGLIEARDRHGELYGESRLAASLEAAAGAAGADSEAIKGSLLADLRSFAEGGDLATRGGRYADDVSVVVVKRL